jgi:hypothetical protein
LHPSCVYLPMYLQHDELSMLCHVCYATTVMDFVMRQLGVFARPSNFRAENCTALADILRS